MAQRELLAVAVVAVSLMAETAVSAVAAAVEYSGSLRPLEEAVVLAAGAAVSFQARLILARATEGNLVVTRILPTEVAAEHWAAPSLMTTVRSLFKTRPS